MTMKRLTNIKNYTELIKLKNFIDRFEYLKLDGTVGQDTFGFERYLNQGFYHSAEWRAIRDQVIARDLGCDLGIDGYEIHGRIYIHHMNPITVDDIQKITVYLLEPEYLICTTHETHNALHFGDASLLVTEPVVRTPFDTCPWKKR